VANEQNSPKPPPLPQPKISQVIVQKGIGTAKVEKR
jgi:hypothetical protein